MKEGLEVASKVQGDKSSCPPGFVDIIAKVVFMYRVTIQLVMNLPLTSKQKFRFGLEVLF